MPCAADAPSSMPLIPLVSLALAQVVRPGGAAGNPPLTLGDGPDLGWLMGVVAVLVLAIAGLAVGFRKVVLGTMQSRAARRDLQVLDMLPLGGKRQLAVVRCYDRTFALGLGEKDVTLVAELDRDAVELDRHQAREERSQAFVERLSAARQRLLGFGPGRGKGASETLDGAAAALDAVDPEATEVPAALLTREIQPREVAPRPGSTKEFVA